MKKKSLQAIEDFYENQGHKGEALRKILLKDKDYQKIFNERKKKLTKKISLTKNEKRKYVMSTNEDYEILSKVKQLEKLKLSKEDKFIIRFVQTQLERDWRKWIIKDLNVILRKYRKQIDF